MSPRKRGRTKPAADREVRLGTTSFVAEGNHIHGTPSDTERASRRGGAYAASSVIERGTANRLKTEIPADAEHVCACGCGQTPSQSDSIFMPGHDSKVRAMGKAVKEGRIKADQLPKIARQYLEEGGMLS